MEKIGTGSTKALIGRLTKDSIKLSHLLRIEKKVVMSGFMSGQFKYVIVVN